MNNYKELFDLTVKGFLLQGYKIYQQCDWLVTLTFWKIIYQNNDMKKIEIRVNIIFDETEGAEQVLVRYSFYEKE